MPHVTLNNGLKLYCQQAGEGPDVVLIHGLTGDLSLWLLINLLPTLAADFRVTCYDLRGHGYSDAPPTGYTSADMAEDLHRLQETLDLGPAYLLGHSFGAVVALHAAVLFPEMVRGVVLSDPFFPGLKHVEGQADHLVGGLEVAEAAANGWVDFRDQANRLGLNLSTPHSFDMGQLLMQMAHLTPAAYEDLKVLSAQIGINLSETHWTDFGQLLDQLNQLTPEQSELIKEQLGGQTSQRLKRLAATTCSTDVKLEAGLTADVIASVQQPVVAIYGEQSPFLATCEYLVQHLPRCKATLLPGAKHLAPLENPEGFVKLVQQQLREMAGVAMTVRASGVA